MTLREQYQAYHRLEPRSFSGKQLYLKAGVRSFPGVHPGVELLAEGAELKAGTLLDATATAGAFALAVQERAEAVTVLEPSRAALRCAALSFHEAPKVQLAAGTAWDAPESGYDAAALIPATERGNARVAAELAGAHRALRPAGRLYLVMHKDQGAKRYERQLVTRFEQTEVLAKRKGWRLVCAWAPKAVAGEVAPPLSFQAAGLELEAEPGVYAAGKLDPGTAYLLEHFPLEAVAGKRLLDLGCGYGVLALKAALSGAEVTALDDDLAAVRSTHRNARRYGLDVRVLHSDLDSELAQGERYDVVLMNPPFHIGKQVRLELPQAFIAAAQQRLKPGGELVLVANRDLAYEPLLAQFAYWETLASDRTFKVLRALV